MSNEFIKTHYSNNIVLLHRPRYIGGRGIVFDRFLCLFISLFCLFLRNSKITRKRLDRFARNFQGSCGVTMGRPDSILGQIGEIARCCDANFFCITQHGDGVCCAFAPQLVLIFDRVVLCRQSTTSASVEN